MSKRALAVSISVVFLIAAAGAQQQHLPPYQMETPTAASMIARGDEMNPDPLSLTNVWLLFGDPSHNPIESLSSSVSRLDLKAPAKAKSEYAKGYTLLMKKDFDGAVTHLAASVSAYPEFVAARNALGSAYLQRGENDLARNQFAKAIALDDHLPNSYLNLACAELALKDYDSAEKSIQKASSIAPLDLQLDAALAYAQLMNHNYAGTIATAEKVHSRKHKGAAIVHYYAQLASYSQRNLQETKNQSELFQREDPKSDLVKQSREMTEKLAAYQSALAAPSTVTFVKREPTPEQEAAQHELARQQSNEETQIAEAEAADLACSTCAVPGSLNGAMRPAAHVYDPPFKSPAAAPTEPFVLRSTVDEVGVLFAATDHGQPVADLKLDDVEILDNQKPPAAITNFRNEAELPLRLGIVIDTSESITAQFSFEQRAAARFLNGVLTKSDDLAFVIGVNNSVLLVQDFTNDQQRIARSVNQLAPGGGTALWDAVAFAAQKLATHPESQPVARLLIVISDGKDNSSTTTLKAAIEAAESGEVFVYTLSTAEVSSGGDDPTSISSELVGDRALKLLAERSGGAALAPHSMGGLDRALAEVQKVIRSRYLISYKPAGFNADGSYRSIELSVRKSGRKLRVYARKGYYARVIAPENGRF